MKSSPELTSLLLAATLSACAPRKIDLSAFNNDGGKSDIAAEIVEMPTDSSIVQTDNVSVTDVPLMDSDAGMMGDVVMAADNPVVPSDRSAMPVDTSVPVDISMPGDSSPTPPDVGMMGRDVVIPSTARLELSAMGLRAFPDRLVGLVATVRDRVTGVLVPGARVTLSMVAGRSSFVLSPTSFGARTITMSHICVGEATPATAMVTSRLVLPANASSRVGVATLVPADAECPTGYRDTGFLHAAMRTPSGTADVGAVQTIDATLAGRDEVATTRVTIERPTTTSPATFVSHIETATPAANGDVTIVMGMRSVLGTQMMCQGASSGEFIAQSGCTVENNGGIRLDTAETITINDAPGLGLPTASLSPSARAHARGENIDYPLAVSQVMAGVFVATVRAGTARANITVQTPAGREVLTVTPGAL